MLSKRAHPEHVHVIAICKIASIEDDHLEKDVHSAGSDMDESDRHKLL
jgi:hypothetical protein